jgi:hypothetical protein
VTVERSDYTQESFFLVTGAFISEHYFILIPNARDEIEISFPGTTVINHQNIILCINAGIEIVSTVPLFSRDLNKCLKIYAANVQIVMETANSVGCHATTYTEPTQPKLNAS